MLQHEAETKLDLRLGGGGGLAVGGGVGGHQAGPGPGPGPPSPIGEKPQHVINTKSPAVPKPSVDVRPPAPSHAPSHAPSPPPAKPAPARPTGVSYNNVSDNQHNSVNRATVHPPPVQHPPTVHHSPPAVHPPPAVSPSSPVAPAVPLLSAPPPRAEVHQQPQLAEPGALRQPHSLQVSEAGARGREGRTPTRQERQQNNTAAASQGGYNFQKIMDDRFEHYKRPASRERSSSRPQLSRDTSRDRLAGARPASRQRTPVTGLDQSENKTNGLDSLNLDSVNASKPHTGNGSVGGGNFSAEPRLPAEDQIRYRGVQQEIPHFGAPPKRTESLYMKPSNNQQATFKVKSASCVPSCL